MSGTLYICGTPIGNIKDITIRCIETLQNVDIIVAEDTRHTLKLLNHYNIKKPLESYHQHNKTTKGPKIIKLLKEGKNVALVSDAGMPSISDPGEDLIRLCYNSEINLTIVPGPTAFTSAIVLSGLKTRSFCFEGFLPNNKKLRVNLLNNFKKEVRTIILYEAPHNLIQTLQELYDFLGDRNIAIVREVTKKYEEVHKGTLQEILLFFQNNSPKGEIVIIIEGISQQEQELLNNEENQFIHLNIQEHFQHYINLGYSSKDAMKLVAKERKISKREIYKNIKIKNQKKC